MFSGTFSGNLLGFLYFALFLFGGIFISENLFYSFKPIVRIWLGTVVGIVLLMWLPAGVSFILGFNKISHIIALVLLIAFAVLSFFLFKNKEKCREINKTELLWAFACVFPLLVFFTACQCNHILKPASDGGFIFGQSTYYDANIHLSFITTPVVQGEMPFKYNILPTQQVSYPFLSDTISSSVYIWGSSLRFAYILPVIAGAFAVFLGAFLFFECWLKSVKKAALAFVLFFFNGGFGFFYFLDGLRSDTSNFTRIFTALYETPTNLNEKTIRWVNTVCDMMIPQRATLFGWVMLFSVLYLLYRAVFLKEKRMFPYAAVLAGLTPMISTHIFMSIGLICVVWMLSRLVGMAGVDKKTIGTATHVLIILVLGVFAAVCLKTGRTLASFDYDKAGLCSLIAGAGFIGISFAVMLALALKNGYFKNILYSWGIFLGIVLLLALPQLLCFTFKQSSNSGFMRAHFNWVNYQDTYVWFYIKNVGITALLIIPAALGLSCRQKSIIAPIALLLLVADTFAFTPNVYDNNKLIYPAYVLACGGVAQYVSLLYSKIKDIKGTKIIAALMLVACSLSAVLTMGREIVSDKYEIYSSAQVEASWWIQENTENNATIVTNDRYNNAVSSLTGRNIVCGSDSMLYPHGFGDQFASLQNDVRIIYYSLSTHTELIDKYNIDYIFVGPDEYSSYNVNLDSIEAVAHIVYQQNGVAIYKINK